MQRVFIFTIVLGLIWGVAYRTAPPVRAQSLTLVVNGTGDAGDANPGDGICDGLPEMLGDQCTLRAAIEELNTYVDVTARSAPGVQSAPLFVYRIEFQLSGTGPFTIAPETALPLITAPMVIDGASQSGATCPTDELPAQLQIILDGSNVTQNQSGLVLSTGSDGAIIRGLVVGNFAQTGISTYTDNNTVICNHIGASVDGGLPMGNGRGLYIGGNNNVIGGDTPADRNVISGNDGTGLELAGTNLQVKGNYIGTRSNGMGALGNQSGFLVSGSDIDIGGTDPAQRNVISGNARRGIYVYGAPRVHILGNYVGVAGDGVTALPNAQEGIAILSDAEENLVQGNIIAYNGEDGVSLEENAGTPQKSTIIENTIFSNSELGIDLGNDGVDTNDAMDVDEGANGHQNYPILVRATEGGSVQATLNGAPQSKYLIQLFRNSTCDPSGYGEGQVFIGQIEAVTDARGAATITGRVAAGTRAGEYLTVTATDSEGNTSEFSRCIEVMSGATETPTASVSPTETVEPTEPGATLIPKSTATVTATPASTLAPTDAPTSAATFTPTPDTTAIPGATDTLPTPTPATGSATPNASASPLPTGDPLATPGNSATPAASATDAATATDTPPATATATSTTSGTPMASESSTPAAPGDTPTPSGTEVPTGEDIDGEDIDEPALIFIPVAAR